MDSPLRGLAKVLLGLSLAAAFSYWVSGTLRGAMSAIWIIGIYKIVEVLVVPLPPPGHTQAHQILDALLVKATGIEVVVDTSETPIAIINRDASGELRQKWGEDHGAAS